MYTDLGTVDGKFSSGVYAPETVLTFTPFDASKKYQATVVLANGADGDGVKIGADGKFTVNATARIDVSAYTRGEGKYWNEIGKTLTDGYLAFNFNTEGASLNGFGGNVYSGTTFATGSNVDGAATLTRIANSWATAHFYYTRINSEFPGDFSDATCKVFEFDYKISSIITNDGRTAQITFSSTRVPTARLFLAALRIPPLSLPVSGAISALSSITWTAQSTCRYT